MFIETPEKQTSVTIVITENEQTGRQTNIMPVVFVNNAFT